MCARCPNAAFCLPVSSRCDESAISYNCMHDDVAHCGDSACRPAWPIRPTPTTTRTSLWSAAVCAAVPSRAQNPCSSASTPGQSWSLAEKQQLLDALALHGIDAWAQIAVGAHRSLRSAVTARSRTCAPAPPHSARPATAATFSEPTRRVWSSPLERARHLIHSLLCPAPLTLLQRAVGPARTRAAPPWDLSLPHTTPSAATTTRCRCRRPRSSHASQEHDNSAETPVKDLVLYEDDAPADRALKLALLAAYQQRLAVRLKCLCK